MDIDGLEALLRRIEAGDVKIVARDLTQPSPLALEILTARPYAYLDDAPLEERRTQAVMSRRWLDPEDAAEIGRLDMAAIERVREEAWPEAGNPDEMHDALLGLGFVTEQEAGTNDAWAAHLAALATDRRATLLEPTHRLHEPLHPTQRHSPVPSRVENVERPSRSRAPTSPSRRAMPSASTP